MNNRKKNNNQRVSIKITGHVLSERYQKCKRFAEKLTKRYSSEFKELTTQGMLEVDWVEHLHKLQRSVGGQTWAVAKGVVVFVDGVFIGADQELLKRFDSFQLDQPTAEEIQRLAREDYLRRLNRSDILFVFLELALAGEYMGSMLFELRYDLLPKSVSWFARLSDPQNTQGLCYRGSTVHRVCRGGWMQAGDLGDGHTATLEDEAFCYKHDRRGILSLANAGPHHNHTQFTVTFQPAAWMDGRYVAFGRLVEGSDVLRRIEHTSCTYEAPDRRIEIQNCGIAGVGLGRHFATHRLRMKGLTQGQPHVHSKVFVDLLLDSFCIVLFERLDERVKRELHAEWMAAALWGRVEAELAKTLPVPDEPDVHDRSSRELLATRYLAGLYDLPDVPDHFIRRVLLGAVDDAIERSDLLGMARSIVRLAFDSIGAAVFDDRPSAQLVAEAIVDRLIGKIDRAISRHSPVSDDKLSTTNTTDDNIGQFSLSFISDSRKKVKFIDSNVRSSSAFITRVDYDGDSKASAVGYIWETLFHSLKEATD